MKTALLAVFLTILAFPAFAQQPGESGQASGTPPGPAQAETTPSPVTANPAVPPAAPAPGAPTETKPAPTETKPAPTADSLVTDSLGQDIATDSYYELVAWCQEIGLDDSGSRQALQARLAQHFKVTLPAAEPAAARTVTVKSARESEYYTITDVNEKYVVLRGDVALEVKDEKEGTLQVIKAATVTYNQTRRTVSAQGDVSYALTRGGKTDTFTGQSLAFDLDSSEAVFYDGSTTRTIDRQGTTLPYNFKGKTITRLSNDTVILQKGNFTTSADPDDPLYHVRAGSVWILAPGEWAIADATLLVGHIPLLYMPGFFWPGDEFFFNPNVGYDNREGSFIQTTTYLFGRKPKQDNPFSFLQLTESGDAGYDLVPNGLFLRKVPTRAGAAAPADKGKSLKLMLDAYSRLGFLGGLAGDFSPLATFRAGVGVSRSIFIYTAPDGTTFYTPFLPQSIGGYIAGQEFWNSSAILGQTVPFRFGLEGTLQTTADFYSVNAGFQYFSDPYFTSDFYTRSEGGLLSAVLSKLNPTGSTPVALQQNLAWNLTGTLDFSRLVKLPFIQSISVPNLSLQASWQSATLSTPSDPQASDPGRSYYYLSSVTAPNISLNFAGVILRIGTTSGAPAQPGGTAPAAAGTQAGAAPANTTAAGTQAGTAPATAAAAGTQAGAAAVKVPATGTQAVTAPAGTTQAGIAAPGASQAAGAASSATPTAGSSGTTAATGNAAAPAPKSAGGAGSATAPGTSSAVETRDPGKGIRMPHAPAQASPKAAGETVRIPFRPPAPQPDVSIGSRLPESSLAVSYQIQPRATLQHTFDTQASIAQGQPNYDILYRTFETGGTTSITAAASLLDRFADLSGTLSVDGLWRNHFNPSEGEIVSSDWENQLQSDLQQDQLSLRTALQAVVRPFPAAPALSTSNLQYNLGMLLYQVTPLLDPVTANWTDKTVSQHTLQSSLVVSTPYTSDSLALTAQLPPLVPSLTGLLNLGAGFAKAKVQGGVSQPAGVNVYQPLVVSGTLDSGTGLSATEEVQYDFTSLATRSTSQVNLWGFSGSYVVDTIAPTDGLGNVTGPIGFNPSTMRVGYQSSGEPIWLWKDRIKLSVTVNSHWYLNLQRYSDNLMDFGVNLTLSIYKFMEFTFSSYSSNTKTYRYIPGWAVAVGETDLESYQTNLFGDLLSSFDFFGPDSFRHRSETGFKIGTISVKGVQHLHDWDLVFQYQGSPQLLADPVTGKQQYTWSPAFSIQVQWNAVPEVKSNVHLDTTQEWPYLR
jgi:hypothetical protein